MVKVGAFMLSKRIITALIGMAVAFFLVNHGDWPFVFVLFLLSIASWQEYVVMMEKADVKIPCFIGIFSLFLLLLCSWVGNVQELLLILTFTVFWLFFKVVFQYRQFSVQDATFSVMGILYIGLLFSYIVVLRFSDLTVDQTAGIETGAVLLWITFLGTWASDTFAYIMGCNFGSRKLCPEISPGKTVEGSIGGLVGCIAVVAILGFIWNMPMIQVVILGLLVGIAAQTGDLFESALKRYTGVKDSGSLLPGHGGVLDRFDSVLFVAPIVYYYSIYVFFV